MHPWNGLDEIKSKGQFKTEKIIIKKLKMNENWIIDTLLH